MPTDMEKKRYRSRANTLVKRAVNLLHDARRFAQYAEDEDRARELYRLAETVAEAEDA